MSPFRVSPRRRLARIVALGDKFELARQCQLARLPTPTLEYVFHPTRKWRFDVCFVDHKLAVEIDGGVFLKPSLDAWGQPVTGGGRHTRGVGYRKDLEKFAEATILGWRILRCLPEHVTSGEVLGWIERALAPKDA